MTVERNKALARVWFEEVMNEHDLEAIGRTYAPDYVHRGPDGHEMSRGQAREHAKRLIAAVPDRHATVEAQVAEGDTVVTRWMSRGTHTGDLLGRSPTGREVVARGIVMSRIAHGLIAEDWEIIHITDDSVSTRAP